MLRSVVTCMMAEDTIALLDALNIRRATVIEFSLGGCYNPLLSLSLEQTLKFLRSGSF